MLLAFILCFSTLPMTAFAQEALQEADAVTEQEEQQEAAPAAEPEEQQEADSAEEQKEAEAVAAPGEETSSDKSTTAETPGTEDSTAESVSDSDAGTQDTGADDEKKAAVQKVQALIDALPETVTEENAESVSAQLEAIDEAMAELTEEQIAALNMERFDAICAALTGLVAVQAEEHVHPICGTTCNDGKNHQNVTWTATKELTNDMAAGNYYLTTDITLSQPWVPKNNVNLCLSGHNITFTKNTSNGDFNVIVIKNIELNLCDAHGQGTVIAEKGASGDICGGVAIEENGVFNLYDGAKINAHDWGVWIDSQGSFTMYGGTVTGKEREGVHVSQAAKFNMKGGEIRDCEIGGGVLVMGRSTSNSNSLDGGQFEMTGGKICNNTSTGAENGGGVTVYYGQYGPGIFNMEGGEISGNTAKNGKGGGVCIKCNADDTSYYPGRFTMLGGIISDNTAENGKGGGVYVETDRSTKDVAMFIFGRNAKITNNIDSNVYLCDNNTIVISRYGLESGASMGVTLEKLPAEGDYTVFATDARSHYVEGVITSDVAGYKTLCSDNEVILYSERTKLHTHPVCGKTCEHDDEHTEEVWRGVSSLNEITTGGYYYLTKDIELDKTWSPAAGVKLCLNGHNITANADGYVIDMPDVGNYTKFTLTDCMGVSGTYGKITHAEGYKGSGVRSRNTFIMYGGEISGNITDEHSGGVFVREFCEFIMYGGVIANNQTSSYGGGVYFKDGGSFTMYGGSITYNSASRGGGVYLRQGSFTVSGKAKITNNTLSDNATANNVGGWGYSIKVDTPGLDNTASIGVTTSDIAEGNYVVVAEGIEDYKKSYQLTKTDLNCFSSDAGYTPKLINNSIVFTNGNMHEHAICGDADCKDGHDDALWLPLTYENNQLKYGGTTASSTTTTGPGYANTDKYDTITEYTLPKGNYYLADSITIDGTIKISGNVNLCLNGHTISTNKVSYAVIYTQYWNLSICDCTGKGSLKVPNNGVTNGIQTSADISDEKGSLYLYGGTISSGNCGVKVKGQLYLYGGTITGNSCGVSDAQKITIGGNVKITDNTGMNVELSSGKIITIDKSLTKDAQIGITTFPKPSGTTPRIQIAAGADSSLKYTDIFKSDITNYVITQTGTDLYLGIHQHNWTYSAEGATITIRCNAENCNLGTDFAATYTVTALEDFIYSGSEKPATVEVSKNATDLTLPEKPTVTYQKKNGNEFEILNGVPTDAGTYRASIKMGDKTASVTYDIVSKEVPNPTITVAGTYTYDGTEKEPSVVVKDGDKEIPSTEYSVSYENNTDAGTATVTITDVAGGNYDVSGSTTFTIGKSTITVTPTAGQKIIYGKADPVLKYSFSGAENSEVPAFTGALSRAEGKDAGKYDITLGTLALEDNSAGSFKAANYELKLVDTTVQFEIVPKTLTAADLEFTTDSIFTKTYDKTTACTTAAVQIRSDAIVDENDVLPTVAGTYVYNSENVKDADKVIFTSEAASAQNYILPAGLTVEHEAKIDKAAQSYLIITSTTVPYGTDFDLTTIVRGGSGTGEVTYSVTNGSGAATITGSILHPVKVGEVTVVAVKAADDNHYQTTSKEKTITISRVDYTGTVGKTVNIIKNRGTAQSGTLTAADFFPEGAVPDGAVISDVKGGVDSDVVANMVLNTATGEFSYTSAVNITSTTDQTCTVTITSTNYENITATMTFHLTDKMTVTIDGLTYTDKTYDGSAMEPTGTLKVSDDKVPVSELEVKYEGTDGTNYSSTTAPTDAGTYKVTYKVAGSNADYTGEKEYTFTISPKDVTANMIGAIAAQEYTGSAITPTPEVKDGNATLTAGTDFEFSYNKTTDVSENTATVTITGKGNYTGTASKTFTIKPKDIKGATITLQENSLIYNGQMQEVTIASVTLNGVTLSADDYDIVKDSNKQISADDSITLTIAGKGNYTGMAYTIWKITKASPVLGDFDVSPNLSTPLTYDGTPKTVTAQPKNGVSGMGAVTVCYEGSNGTTYARSETAPTNAGTYKVILSVAEGKNYTEAEIEAGTLTIEKADLTVEDVTEFFEYTKKGEQTINLAELVPGARSYTPDAFTNDNGIVSGDITIDATGLMKFALSELTKDNIDNKVTVPVTITSENYKDVRVNVIIYISPEYRIIDGANSSWTQNTDGTVVIRGNGEFSRFHAVKVDGKVIDPANYEAKEGSTIITLKAEYLKTLATGSHTFAIVWNNGIAGTNFTVAANTSGNNSGNNSNNNDSNHGSDNSGNNDSGNTAGTAANTAAASAQELDKVPATGDPFGIWLTLFVISLTGLAGILARRKKN